MLKKLLKYDLKFIFKGLIIFYLLSIFFALLTRIFLNVDNSFIMNILGKICSGATISMLFNILINNIMRLWGRFKINFYGDESYLTHTLPVTKKDLYLSKVLASIISLFTSVLVICISLFVAYYSKENIMFVKNLLLPLANIYESTVVVIILQFVFVSFLEILNMLNSGYVGIVLGHRKDNNKTLCSVIFGFVIYLLTQIFALLVVFIVALFNKDLMNLFYTTDLLNVDTIKICIYLAMGIYAVNIIVLSIANLKLFEKGVNVD